MAYENDILTRNSDDELSVRVVQSTGDNPAVAYDDVYTRDNNGKLAVRVVGAGGGDSHNLGWYATSQALTEAHPTATAGDWAIVGATDTVWIWDTDNSQWVDSDTKGQVTSVNNQTGAVTVQETLVSGTNIKTVDGNSLLGSGNLELSTYLPFPNTWTTTGTTKALCDDIAADTTATKGKAYLGEVTCSDLPASMANAEIVVEIMDGTTAANKVIVLTLTSGNTAPYMWKYTYWNGGTDVSGWQTWATSAQGAKADTAVQPGDLATVATTGAYSDLTGTPTIPAAQVNSDWNASSGVAEILNKPTIPDVIQVSSMPTASATELGKVYQFIGTTDANYTHGYFYECVSDGQTPATYSWSNVQVQASSGGLPSQTGNTGKFLTTDGTDASWATVPAGQTIQVDTIPTADATQVGRIVQYVGTTSGNKIYGLFYKCTEYNSNYYWSIIDVVPDYYVRSTDNSSCVLVGKYQSGGGFSHATGIGYNVKVYNYGVALGDSAIANQYGVGIGYNASVNANYAVGIGYNVSAGNRSATCVGDSSSAQGEFSSCFGSSSGATGQYAIALGYGAKANALSAIQIGTGTNSTAGTFQVGSKRLLESDGTIPEARLADTTNARQGDVLTLDSNGNAVWQAGGGGGGSVPTLTWYSVSTAGNTLTIADTSSAQLVKVYKNGLLLQPTDDYTISGTTLTTVAALVVGDKITTEVF